MFLVRGQRVWFPSGPRPVVHVPGEAYQPQAEHALQQHNSVYCTAYSLHYLRHGPGYVVLLTRHVPAHHRALQRDGGVGWLTSIQP